MKFSIFSHFSLKRDKPEGTPLLYEERKPGNNVTTKIQYDSRIYDLKILNNKCWTVSGRVCYVEKSKADTAFPWTKHGCSF